MGNVCSVNKASRKIQDKVARLISSGEVSAVISAVCRTNDFWNTS